MLSSRAVEQVMRAAIGCGRARLLTWDAQRLREAGFDGRADVVRPGYAAAIALRWIVLAGTLRQLAHEDWHAVRTSQGRLVAADDVRRQRVRLCDFLLDRADEARSLGVARRL